MVSPVYASITHLRVVGRSTQRRTICLAALAKWVVVVRVVPLTRVYRETKREIEILCGLFARLVFVSLALRIPFKARRATKSACKSANVGHPADLDNSNASFKRFGFVT